MVQTITKLPKSKVLSSASFQINDLPECSHVAPKRDPELVANYFKALFKQSNQKQIEVPSAMTLSGFFKCSVLDVLKAFGSMKENQAYDYKIKGLDYPIVVSAPAKRKCKKASI
jgi:hypothetical protein